MTDKVSPLAPLGFPELPDIDGVRLATAEAGVRYRGRTDVLMVLLREGTAAAGVLTRSKCPSAPVDWCRKLLAKGRARALVVNSGNANAFTGRKGAVAAALTARATAKVVGCRQEAVYLASTGVIGEPLEADRIEAVLQETAAAARPGGWLEAARAIMTTDTYPKGATRTAPLGGVPVAINGIAKGAGMFPPDMATMLAFIFTDAPIAAEALGAALRAGLGESFNAITVDSDTSTSDTLIAFATGAAAARGAPAITRAGDRRLGPFRAALKEVMFDLAQQVVRDGEGASKLIAICVRGAVSVASARRIAFSIANSPLVKTAISGEDANWGRIVMAVGKAGEPADRDRLAISFGPHRVAFRGERDPAYDEASLSAYMKNREIEITVDLGLGRGADKVWTCDLTHDYLTINGSYRT
ncbi:MAG: bifunctional glutamate N-acetyltransferase/amino-acid acetyltransferase ArgJ [Hyphomicrobiales bacterium]|nr:bifunctional glutamate N-acetyltransferase/amino-acid acetyltransferase ArgJ [Hyphomicrobiales bacterium]